MMGEILKKALEKAGMNQKQLATKMGISAQSISKWVRGESEPTRFNIVSIGNILGMDVANELMQDGLKKEKKAELKETDIKDFDDYEKAHKEALSILNDSGIRNYSHATYRLLEWLITAIIGMDYHNCIHNRDPENEFCYDDIFYYLNDFENEYGKELEQEFFKLGGDLFESSGDYRLVNHDYAKECYDLWFKFRRGYMRLLETESFLYNEFHIALLDVLYQNSWY